MHVRCPDCKTTASIETRPVPPELRCGCGGLLAVRVPPESIGSDAEFEESARSLADSSAIDVESARSILLGIMGLEDATAFVRAPEQVPAPSAPSAPPAPPTPRMEPARVPIQSRRQRLPLDLDPGFAEAIAEGFLTQQQAAVRGDRNAFASRLAREYRLPEKLAFDVADNRMSLAAAIRLTQKPPAGRARIAWDPRMWGGTIALALLLALGLILARGAWVDEASPAPAPESGFLVDGTTQALRTPSPTKAAAPIAGRAPATVRHGDDGRPVEISAPEPASVLTAFCRDGAIGGRFEPVELTSAVPPLPGVRLGIVRDREQPGGTFAIRIRRDGASGRWIAGDGRSPIDPQPAPLLRSDLPRYRLPRG